MGLPNAGAWRSAGHTRVGAGVILLRKHPPHRNQIERLVAKLKHGGTS